MSIRGYVIVARVASAKGKGKEGRGLDGWGMTGKRKETGEEGREGSTCNQSPLNALPPTFQNHGTFLKNTV